MLQDTPQKDFLVKNLTKLTNKSIPKSSSYDSLPCSKRIDNTTSHSDNELEGNENPFIFSVSSKVMDPNAPMKPARQGPGTSKLALESSTASNAPPTRPRFDRQISENKAIKKIQA